MIKIPAARPPRKARIEIIPLIDIVFFLLATFVMVSMSMVKNHGMQVRLPAASTGASQDRSGAAVISVSDQGEVYFNKELLKPENLQGRLLNFKSSHSDPKIFIQGDESAQFGKIVTVLDEARKAGIVKTAIQTTKK